MAVMGCCMSKARGRDEWRSIGWDLGPGERRTSGSALLMLVDGADGSVFFVFIRASRLPHHVGSGIDINFCGRCFHIRIIRVVTT